jgi:hypothetical protein
MIAIGYRPHRRWRVMGEHRVACCRSRARKEGAYRGYGLLRFDGPVLIRLGPPLTPAPYGRFWHKCEVPAASRARSDGPRVLQDVGRAF